MLVVDDEPGVREYLGACLENLGHQVTTATSGLAALACLQAGPRFDLVFCDNCLPDLSGRDLYRRLANDEPEYLDRFVLVTGDAFGETLLPESARIPLLHKPFSADQVREIVECIMAERASGAEGDLVAATME